MEVVDQLDWEIQTATAGCHYGLNELMIHFTNENKDKIMESVKTSASSSMKISGVSSPDIFLNKTQWALCVLLEDKTWKWLSVTTTLFMDLKTILNQEPSIHRLPHPLECPTASIGSWSCPFKYPSCVYVPTPLPSSFLQPVYHGTITTVNSYYTFSTICRILDESEISFSVRECYKLHSLAECTVKIKGSMALNG